MGTGCSVDKPSQSRTSEEATYRNNPQSLEKEKGSNLDELKSKAVEKEAEKAKEETGDGAKLYEVSSKKAIQVKLPHNCEAILREADSPLDWSSLDKLYDQLLTGVSLKQKRKKYWIEKKSNSNCFMLLARYLSITWSENNLYWKWSSLKETSTDTAVDVAELLNVCWLEVHANFNMAYLSPGVVYEVLFVIMMRDTSSGWDVPVNVRLTFPNGIKQEHQENFKTQPRGLWMEIPVGEVVSTPDNNAGQMEIYMYEYKDGKWKTGLVIKGVIIRPINRS
ncbi:hypothetical protein K2173_003525 [Erythroxylum novogranatense]|uniref:Uncharacterized protein n=1 Tax=Erythroxylum novogranatense TaxID=1862640 RepID=A0AAV8TC93_9ROSI|nr:hypothetical protein K2173_003525 [Erythroxylum novogranatense]